MARKDVHLCKETKCITFAPKGHWIYDEEGTGHWVLDVEYTFREYEKFIRDVKRTLKTFNIELVAMAMENELFVEMEIVKPAFDAVIWQLNELSPKFIVEFYE